MTPLLRNVRIRLQPGQLFWREVGRGSTIVFLHGSWQDGDQWLPVMADLGEQYHCLAPDLLGFGTSDRPQIHYSVELQVEWLAEFFEALRLPSVYLVGHSLGAWIAASYALRYPSQVRGLVLLSPEGVGLTGENRWQTEKWVLGPGTVALLRLVRPLTRLLGWQAIDRLLQLHRRLRQFPVACKLLFQRRQAELNAEMLHDRLSWLKVPVLVMQGQQAPADEIARSQAIVQQAPMGRMHWLMDGGVDVAQSHAIETARAIRAFVEI